MANSTLPGLAGWILVTALAAVSGSVTAKTAAGFYGQLDKPSWAPPPWLFGPAWLVLYVCMGTAAWRIWRPAGFAGAAGPLALYGGQLLLNAAWTWFFFVRRTGRGATVEVLLLWLAIAVTLVVFWQRDLVAGLLFVPYLAWVTFAAALTISCWRRNPTLL